MESKQEKTKQLIKICETHVAELGHQEGQSRALCSGCTEHHGCSLPIPRDASPPGRQHHEGSGHRRVLMGLRVQLDLELELGLFPCPSSPPTLPKKKGLQTCQGFSFAGPSHLNSDRATSWAVRVEEPRGGIEKPFLGVLTLQRFSYFLEN